MSNFVIPDLKDASPIRPGTDDPIIRMQGCPDCDGFGWRNATPFASFNKRFVQCPTCLRSKAHYDEHGCIPEDVAVRMSAESSNCERTDNAKSS